MYNFKFDHKTSTASSGKHGVYVLSLVCMWDEEPTWICTVFWSYMHTHTPSYYTQKSKNGGLPGGSSMYVPCMYRWLSVCQHAWVAFNDHFLHVGPGTSVDMYRILVIHALACAMWITLTGSRIVCLWMAVARMCPV
jgi:hypothetical protein